MGLKRLIDAVDYLRRDRDPSILLLIAGKGPLQKELERHIHEKSLSNHVRLLGFVPDEDLPLQYRAANMSVVPTISLEGFGLITLESLASGTPVLVTPVGGMPEPIRPLSDNLVLSGTAAEDVAQGIGDALTGRRVLPTTDECISYVRRHFDWSVIAKRTSEVYADVVAQAVSASA
jgi:glycosyltransferase involved in cell wall biosynthesis